MSRRVRVLVSAQVSTAELDLLGGGYVRTANF